MSTILNSRVLSNTYKDDFSDSDGYYRILFNSGRPLQARELTQMQTILQEQIKRLGNNIFKEGGVVKPGEAILNNSYEFAKLITTQYGLPTQPNSIVGNTFTGNISGITARIIEVVPAENSDPSTIYIAYTNGPVSQSGTTTPRFTPGETITDGSTTLRVQLTNTDANPAVGRGLRYSIGAGIYYAKGFFVFTEAQSYIVSKYTDTANEIVGYKIIEDVVNVDDDIGLYDNQGAVPNISSPGADRLRITLSLTKESAISAADDNFIPIATIKDGVVYRTVDEDNSYNVLRDVIATRIKENSGDYIVKPFKLSFEEDSDQDNLIMNVSPGTAVVDGYRANLYAPYKRRIVKPSTTKEIQNEITAIGFGNYVLVDNGTSNNTAGMPNINSFEKLNLRTAVNHGGSTIGTARVRQIVRDSGNFLRYYLFDIQMNAGQNFRNVVSIGNSGTDYFNLYRPLGKAELKEVTKNNLLFNLPQIRPQALDDISLQVQRRFQQTTDGAGAVSLTLTASGETFANTADWIAAPAGDDILNTGLTFTSSPVGQVAANITGLSASTSYEFLVYVNKSIGAIRSKTKTETTITVTPDGNGNIPLGKADIFKVKRVTINDSDGLDISSRYELDNGQRDNYYALGSLKLIAGNTAPATAFVRYEYFTHGANGDFFAINSYTGQVDYNKIQNYDLANGNQVNLRNVIDFRSIMDSDGEFSNSTTGARINELPQVNDTVQSDITYYLPERAILTINSDGILVLRSGDASFSPVPPRTPVGNLPLYDVFFGANTLNDSDLFITKLDHRRYTMKDIARLEERVDRNEEMIALNLLEIDTKNLQVFDSSGLDRTKSGFFVDNFSTQLYADTKNPDYRAAIDPQLNLLVPTFNEDNIRLIYDSDASTNVIRKGDNVYLKHSVVEYISQTQASKAIKINPFEAIVYIGDIQLSPSSDEWREVKVRAKKMVDGGTKLDTTQAYLWNNWQWNWGGKKIEDLKVGDTTNTKTETTSTKIHSNVNKVVSEETLLEVINEKVIDIALIPFMRSRKVYFKAEGLRPNSKVWAYFDGTRVDAWVREETFVRMSTDHKDYGNTQNNATAHPEGATELITDTNGAIEGSFFIPNTNSIRFRTGIQEFMILDVSGGDKKKSGTIADALYAATGYLDTIDQTIKSTRVLNVDHVRTSKNRYIPPSGNYGGGGKEHSSQGEKYYQGTGSTGAKGAAIASDMAMVANHSRSSDGPGSCFLAGTMVTMADGTSKAIETIQLGEQVAIGGNIFAKGEFLVNDLHDYKGIKVSGSHPVYENGKWVRVANSKHGVPINNETVVVYNFGTENRRLEIEGIIFTDYFEASETEALEVMQDVYIENWREIVAENRKGLEERLNNEL